MTSTNLRFDDQVAVITGAGGGLGKQYALLLASRGARIVANDTGGSVTGNGSNTQAADAAAAEIRQRPSPTATASPAPKADRRSSTPRFALGDASTS